MSTWLLQLMLMAQADPAAAAGGVAATPIFRMVHIYWYIVPLVIVISLVYSASRHEEWRRIWMQSLRLAGAILGILLVTTIILLLINTQV